MDNPDILIAEIGSTKTMASGFTSLLDGGLRLIGQGIAATTIPEGDVSIGLRKAIADLGRNLGQSALRWKTALATCSAAGGLRMAVHGLVRSMTSKAAREAALGAGAIVVSETWGLLTQEQVTSIVGTHPKILLLAGGVDNGDTEKVLSNARVLASAHVPFSVVFAGNKSIRQEIDDTFRSAKIRSYITENVYPAIDRLNVLPARRLIQEIFERHLVESPGMESIREIVDGPILPTPGAVMLASQTLAGHIGDLVTVDVGGATTDIHSVTRGSEELQEIQLTPEPEAKRTVEGDLGVYVNAPNVLNLATHPNVSLSYRIRSGRLPLFPTNQQEADFILTLSKVALFEAIGRHVGRRKRLLTFKGETEAIEGKDLTAVKTVIGTGGVFARIPGAAEILKEAFIPVNPDFLLPTAPPRFMLDHQYVMAAAGLLSINSPEAALGLMRASLNA